MSLKRNIVVNTASQLYVVLICIAIVPLYIEYMGAEAYGLVGFFTMLQAWFLLLDMGLTPTMARETARFHGGSSEATDYRRFVRSLEGLFFLVALVGGGGIYAASGYIADDWLQSSHLSSAELLSSIQLIAVIVAFRWMCGLYRGAITGAERLVWLGGFNASIATLRFVGVLPVLHFIGVTPTLFFKYQLCAAIIELAGLMIMAYRLLPQTPNGERVTFTWAPLRATLKFSLSIAAVTSIWVVVTQMDKLLLSKLLPLAEYGYFTLAVLVASGIMVISGSISSAILPRLTKLEAQGDQAGLIRIYRQATQLVAVIVSAASLTIAFCAEPLLWAWTGDKILVEQAAPILALYALGNGIMAVSAFPYYLQYAKGDLRLHLIGHIGFVVLLIPALIWAVGKYGGIGAGYVWLVVNLIYFVVWVPIVHHKFAPGLNFGWFSRDTFLIIVSSTFAAYLLHSMLQYSEHRLWQVVQIAGFGLVVLVAGSSVSSLVWGKVRTILRS
ncbi:MAG: oligosaccharide flippase family protein [Candidatus Polarisedimenticolaceae bacterium]|nr:oligosaccharide flippase family protein [Candidatus Polarisedimenticolaceae bacterium]